MKAMSKKYQSEETARVYEEYYTAKYQRADRLEKQLLTKLLDHFRDAKSLLEVGCGTGHFTRWIDSKGIESCGIDTSAPMLKAAKKLWTEGCLLQSDGSHLPFKDKSIDLIAYITSLEYLPDAASTFLEAFRVAKKGVIVGLMNKNSASTARKKIEAKTKKESFYKGAHFYSIDDIKNHLHNNFEGKYHILFWSTTFFPKVFGDLESAVFPFGAFLGVAIEVRDTA